MVYNSLRRISKTLQNAPPIISPTNNIPLQTDNSSISSDNNSVIEVNSSSNLVSAKLRGRPAGTTDNDKRNNLKIRKNATEEAARMWKECRDKGLNIPGALSKIIDTVHESSQVVS